MNGVKKPGQGMTDFGYYTGERVSAHVEELEDRVAQDQAYIVEVFEMEAGGIHIRLSSENRRVAAETHGRLETKGYGFQRSLYQSTEEPLMPGEYENPHQAIQTYAEYALQHQKAEGITMEGVDWDELLDEGNRGL